MSTACSGYPPESLPSSVSSESQAESQPYHGFGFHAPIIDFYENGELRSFEPIANLLEKGPEKCMAQAMETWRAKGEGRNLEKWKMRWVHIPSNNTEWVERVIKCISRSKAKEKERKIRKEATTQIQKALEEENVNSSKDTEEDDLINVDHDIPMCLQAEYWGDQQRGCIEHSASHLLYAQHMVPFFSPIFDSDREDERAKGDMVLFMPYIHWATSSLLADRNNLIRSLGKDSKNNRQSHAEVDRMEISPKLKLINAFLFPKNKRCLHLRRTLDQFYYPTLPQEIADKRTVDQVVYRFAMKQYQKQAEEKSGENKGGELSGLWATEEFKNNIGISEREVMAPELESEIPWQEWKDPNVLMVNQFWMWVIDEDTVITSFPAKLDKSELARLKKNSQEDKGCVTKLEKSVGCIDNACRLVIDELWNPYDSTDIWTSVVREIQQKTEYGKRSKKTALHLAWTIADQATGVIHKRSLPPHLQFIDMFEMEISEIKFNQAECFDTFTVNVQLAHNTNELGKVLSLLDSFQIELLQNSHVPVWRSEFSAFSTHFRRKLEYVTNHHDDTLKLGDTNPARRHMYTPPMQNEKICNRQCFNVELKYEFLQFADLVANAHTLQEVTKTLDAACSDLAVAGLYNEISSAIANLEHAKGKIEEIKHHSRKEMVGLSSAIQSLEHAITTTKSDSGYNLIYAQSYIESAKSHLNYDLVSFVELLFTKLESRVKRARTTKTLNKNLDIFIRFAKKSLDAYNDMILDDLFDIRTETRLVREINDIIDELNIIQTIERQQQAVIKPFRDHMLPASKPPTVDFFDCSRLGNHVGELRKSAETTYTALSDLLDLKQNEASAIEARSASKDAKASAKQAEEAAHLSEVTVKQGWSIMVFTMVTIVFLPLSFFTSLFGMNAKELMDGDYTIGFFSAIMWPISFAVTCIYLSLALSVGFRGWLVEKMKIILRGRFLLKWFFQDGD